MGNSGSKLYRDGNYHPRRHNQVFLRNSQATFWKGGSTGRTWGHPLNFHTAFPGRGSSGRIWVRPRRADVGGCCPSTVSCGWPCSHCGAITPELQMSSGPKQTATKFEQRAFHYGSPIQDCQTPHKGGFGFCYSHSFRPSLSVLTFCC